MGESNEATCEWRQAPTQTWEPGGEECLAQGGARAGLSPGLLSFPIAVYPALQGTHKGCSKGLCLIHEGTPASSSPAFLRNNPSPGGERIFLPSVSLAPL